AGGGGDGGLPVGLWGGHELRPLDRQRGDLPAARALGLHRAGHLGQLGGQRPGLGLLPHPGLPRLAPAARGLLAVRRRGLRGVGLAVGAHARDPRAGPRGDRGALPGRGGPGRRR
ncbi:unnamed protein product, partial [Heterosigma akashiwo]